MIHYDDDYILLLYLANNCTANRVTDKTGIAPSMVVDRVLRMGATPKRQCPTRCGTASQSPRLIERAARYADGMQDRRLAEKLVQRIQYHRDKGLYRVQTIRRVEEAKPWEPQRRSDGTFAWWEHLNGNPETGELHNQEVMHAYD